MNLGRDGQNEGQEQSFFSIWAFPDLRRSVTLQRSELTAGKLGRGTSENLRVENPMYKRSRHCLGYGMMLKKSGALSYISVMLTKPTRDS